MLRLSQTGLPLGVKRDKDGTSSPVFCFQVLAMKRVWIFLACLLGLLASASSSIGAGTNKLQTVGLSNDGLHFVVAGSNSEFRPWGFNYDHDGSGRLLEDYWQLEWDTVVGDFREMKRM